MKPHRRLTAKRIAEACRSTREQWLSDDDGSRGSWRLLCRVSQAGSPRLYVRLSALQSRTKPSIPLGLYSRVGKPGFLTLAQARAKALVIVASLGPMAFPKSNSRLLGSDGIWADHVRCKTDSSAPDHLSETATSIELFPPVGAHQLATLMDVCNVYVAHLRKDNKQSANDVAQRFRLYIEPCPLANELAHTIPPEAFFAFIKGMIREFQCNPVNRHGQHRGLLTPEKVRQYLSCAYQYVIDCKKDAQFSGDLARFAFVTKNLVKEGVRPLQRVRNARTRNLSALELGLVWRRIRHDERLVARVLRLAMLLGGQRLLQLLRVESSNVSVEARTILLFDGKGGRKEPREHLLPLPPMALKEVSDLLDISKSCSSRFLIAGTKNDSHTRANTISRFVTGLSRILVAEGEIVTPFQFADVRRTMETRLSASLVPRELRARVLSHGLSGVQERHYDMYDYLPQKLEILQKVEDMLKGFENVL